MSRHVKKGERAFHILAPCTRKITETDETGQEHERPVVYGFRSVPVFGLEQTEGDPLPGPDPELTGWLQSLPLREVADCWRLSIEAYNGAQSGAKGRYSYGRGIALGVRNLATWTHELCHAADDRLGQLTETGQHWRSEIVAELGGATLLQILGHETETDVGGAREYIARYAEDSGRETTAACQVVLNRVCNRVALMLDTAEALRTQPATV